MTALRQATRTTAEVLDAALLWLRQELEVARRENQDAQFLATAKGAFYIRRS